MSLNHAIDHPHIVDSRAHIDFFWRGQTVPPLPTQRPSALVSFLLPLLSVNVFTDLFFLHLNSKLFANTIGLWFLAPRFLLRGATAWSYRGYQITKNKAADSVYGTGVFRLVGTWRAAGLTVRVLEKSSMTLTVPLEPQWPLTSNEMHIFGGIMFHLVLTSGWYVWDVTVFM